MAQRVETMYLRCLQTEWKEHAFLKIFEKEFQTEFSLLMLGVVQDEERKKELAVQEVKRRLGPDSEVTKAMYKGFVSDVLHKRVVKEVRKEY